jgi:hypothetical protein
VNPWTVTEGKYIVHCGSFTQESVSATYMLPFGFGLKDKILESA